MLQQRVRAAHLFPALICCAMMTVPGISGAQTTISGSANPPPAPAPVIGAPETIEVEAPRLLKFETPRVNGTLKKVSLEGPVSYADLDLRSDDGVAQLRDRIASEAADICAQLAQVYPVYAAAGTSCVKDAIEDGNIRANRVITQAREQPSY